MIQKFFEGIAKTIIRHPLVVAGLIFILFCIGLYGMSMLTMQTGWKTYIDKESPAGVIQTQYEKDFGPDVIILIIETSEPLSPKALSYIEQLQKDFGQQQNIESSLSIVDVLRMTNGGRLPV